MPTQTPASNSDARKRNAERDQPGSLSPTGPTSPTSTYSNSAREWRPGDKALVEVEVTDLMFEGGRTLVEVRPVQRFGGSFTPAEALRPTPAAGEAATEAEVERLTDLLDEHTYYCGDPRTLMVRCSCGGWERTMGDGNWAANHRSHLVDVIAAAGLLAGGVPGRSEAEIKAEAWDEAVRECHGLGWMHDFALSDALERNPYRATRVAGTTDTEGSE